MSLRAAALACALALTACENQIPTATGTDLFPEGTTPQSIRLVVPASQFVVGDTVVGGYTSLHRAPYLLVAEAFDGVLYSHAIADLTDFPDSVRYVSGGSTTVDRTFTYGPARLVTTVDTLSQSPPGAVTLRLWALEQPWDSATVSWTHAVDRPGEQVAWHTPGGTLGRLLAETTWEPGDTLQRDTASWELDSLTVAQMAAEDFPGIAVTTTSDTRVQIGQLVLRGGAHPSSKPDTTVTFTVSQGPQTSIVTPAPAAPGGALQVGGPTGERTILRIRLPESVPDCESGSGCGEAPFGRVSLNRVVLTLQPVPVPQGYRPLAPTTILVRRVTEPELGARAPLGEVLNTNSALDTVPVSAYAGGTPQPIRIDLTPAIRNEIAQGRTEIAVALLPATARPAFGMLWFAGEPALELVYTLPLDLTLP